MLEENRVLAELTILKAEIRALQFITGILLDVNPTAQQALERINLDRLGERLLALPIQDAASEAFVELLRSVRQRDRVLE